MRPFYTLLTILLSSAVVSVKAQHYTLGIGPEVNFPSGNSSSLSSIGLGGAIKAEYGLSPKYAITASGSLVSFLGRNYFGIKTETLNLIPVKVGFKYYTDVNFYFEAQMGAAFPFNNANSNIGFAWSPGLGTYLKTKGKKMLDVGLRYEGITNARLTAIGSSRYSTFSFIGVRMAYVFNLR